MLAALWSNSGVTEVATTLGEILLRDPTEPATYSYQALGNDEETEGDINSDEQIILEAVIISDTTRLAIINNRIFKEGDEIGGNTIKSIEPQTVILDSDREKGMKLRLSGKPIKEISE